jgi:UDP-N-acetyl-D-glucosamine dehydrogenase
LEALKIGRRQGAVIGLGYVGLPLALEIALAGFKVVGIDVELKKTTMLKAGKFYNRDASDE